MYACTHTLTCAYSTRPSVSVSTAAHCSTRGGHSTQRYIYASAQYPDRRAARAASFETATTIWPHASGVTSAKFPIDVQTAYTTQCLPHRAVARTRTGSRSAAFWQPESLIWPLTARRAHLPTGSASACGLRGGAAAPPPLPLLVRACVTVRPRASCERTGERIGEGACGAGVPVGPAS